jgi:hypothetical protein
MRNIFMAIIVILLIVWVLLAGLAWVALGFLKFIFIITVIFGIGWLWGRFTK